MKKMFNAICVIAFMFITIVGFSYFAGYQQSEKSDCVVVSEVKKVESTNANDAPVSYSIKEFIGYHEADGNFVPTHVVVEEYAANGLTRKKVFKANNFSHRDIHDFNGKQLPTNWELE
jgi:hypothetical protein